MEQVAAVIVEKIRPALNAHGGDIDLVGITPDGFVKVRLQGACAGCPGAGQTMTDFVETVIKEACPAVKGVRVCHEVSDDLIAQALNILRAKRT